MANKMTDIYKALELCKGDDLSCNIEECPYNGIRFCIQDLHDDVRYIINQLLNCLNKEKEERYSGDDGNLIL